MAAGAPTRTLNPGLILVRSYPGPLAAFAGLLAAFSTFYGALLIVDAALFAFALLLWRRPGWWAWCIAVPIAISAIWALHPLAVIWFAGRILALAIIFTRARREPVWLVGGLLGGLAVQTFALLANITLDRPAGLAGNPGVLAEVGFAVLALLPATGVLWLPAFGTAAVTVGMAGGRAALLASGAYLMLMPATRLRRLVIGLAIAGVSVASLGWGALLDRTTTVQGDIVTRLGTVIPRGDEQASDARFQYLRQRVMEERRSAGETVDARNFVVGGAELEESRQRYPYERPRLSWAGYGYGSFVDRTHTQAPHNLFALAAYDMGLLALPIGGVIVYALQRRIVPLAVAAGLGIIWMLSAEQWDGAGLHYLLAVVVATSSTLKRDQKNHGYESWSHYVRRIGKGIGFPDEEEDHKRAQNSGGEYGQDPETEHGPESPQDQGIAISHNGAAGGEPPNADGEEGGERAEGGEPAMPPRERHHEGHQQS